MLQQQLKTQRTHNQRTLTWPCKCWARKNGSNYLNHFRFVNITQRILKRYRSFAPPNFFWSQSQSTFFARAVRKIVIHGWRHKAGRQQSHLRVKRGVIKSLNLRCSCILIIWYLLQSIQITDPPCLVMRRSRAIN